MIKIFRAWLDHLFADEQALLLVVLLLSGAVILAFFGSMLAPVFASMILAYLTLGLVQWLEQRFGIRHLPAVWGIYTLFLIGLGAFLLVLVPLIWRQASSFLGELPVMAQQLQGVLFLLPEQYPQLVSKQQMQTLIDTMVGELANGGQLLVSYSLASIGQSIVLLVYLILVPILVFFFLKDGQKIVHWFTDFLPNKRVVLSNVWHEMDDQLANYVRGKVVEIAIVGVTAYVLFLILGLNYPALLAMIVGLSVLIPYIGATLATIPVALVGYVQWGLGTDFYTLIIAYFILQALDGNVLVPLLFSEAVNLHPVAIIIAVLIFGGLWGFWGVFFAIPLATLLKAILNAWPRNDHNEHTEVT